MTALFDFKDAVNASVLNPDAEYAVFYMDGSFQNEAEVRRQCPRAKLFAITVRGATGKGIFACDCETGDLTPAEAIEWVGQQVALGVELVTVYANLSTWEGGLLSGLAHYGTRIRRWVADFNNDPGSLPSWADADQYATGNVDLDVARARFFQNATPVTPKPEPHGKAHFAGSYDLSTGDWTIHGMPGINVHFAGGQRWASAEIQLQIGEPEGGHWRVKGIPLDSKPLGD